MLNNKTQLMILMRYDTICAQFDKILIRQLSKKIFHPKQEFQINQAIY